MKKKILITILIVLAILCTFSIIDFLKVKENEKPIFSLMQNKIKDGGTIEYIGLGYKIIDYHKIEGISGCYKKTHISPIFIDESIVYMFARGRYVFLTTTQKEYYNILAKFYDVKTLDKLVKEIQRYELLKEIKYKSYKFNGKSMEINYKPGYGVVPFSDEEMEWFRLSLDAYNNENIEQSDKYLLKRFIKENFSITRSKTKDANIRDAIKELIEENI